MVFSSLLFIFIFLPATLLLYLLSVRKTPDSVTLPNLVLFAASLVFYAWGGVRYLLLLLLVIAANYFLTLQMDTAERPSVPGKPGRRDFLFFLIVFIDLGNLFYFKYFNFFTENAIALGNALGIGALSRLVSPGIVLPIGISFYTFQILSYAADVYTGRVPVQKSFLKLALYVIMFPQLIAGPIVRYSDVNEEISARSISREDVEYGIRRFILGFFKKVVIANLMGGMADVVFDTVGAENCIYAWIGILSYGFQIYYDFSAYSDMAIGIGRMLGFHFNENFDLPFHSESIREFWRRWHISLSSWFRDYVYIPLGGSRKGTLRTYLNLLIVFFLTGFWHGAAWQYIVWGLFHGAFILLERFGLGRILKRMPHFVQHLYTIFVVTLSWAFFRSSDIGAAFRFLRGMFAFDLRHYRRYPVLSQFTGLYIAFFFIAAFFSFTRLESLNKYAFWRHPVCVGVRYLLLFAVSVLYLSGLRYNPFIYFQF